MGMPSLLEGLVAWWDFKEDYSLGFPAHDSIGNIHLPTSGRTGSDSIRSAQRISVPGGGTGIRTGIVYRPVSEGNLLPALLPVFTGNMMISARVFIKAGSIGGGIGSGTIFQIYPKLQFSYAGILTTLNIGFDLLTNDDGGGILHPNQWQVITFWRRFCEDNPHPAIMGLCIDDVSIQAEANMGGAPDPPDNNSVIMAGCNYDGVPLEIVDGGVDIDWIGLWAGRREDQEPQCESGPILTGQSFMLTQEEQAFLYNDGNPLTLQDIMEAQPAECKSDVCCEGTKTAYDIESASVTDEAVASFDPCPGQAAVSFDPPSGNVVVVPFFVKLTSDNPDATIRYTTNGTSVTPLSTAYTGPIEITSLSQVVQAKAYVEGCDEPVQYMARWKQISGLSIAFRRFCDPDDKVGRWDVWAPNARDDHHWTLQINNTADLDIQRIEIYQLDTNGDWTTGQAWATDSPIYPPAPWPQNIAFNVYPLGAFVAAVQQHAAYVTTYGTVAAGTNFIDLYGEIEFIPSGYFKLLLVLQNGDVIEAVVDAVPCDPPPPPPPPCFTVDKPVLVPICSGIRVDFTVPAPARDYRVWRKTCSGPDAFVQVETGNGSGAISFSDTPLVFGIGYIYYVEIRIVDVGYEHCPEWVASEISNCGDTICPPSATEFFADPDVVDDGDGTTFHITTVCATSATIDGPGFGGPTPIGTLNAPTTVVLGECVGDPGDLLTYTLAVTNACGTVNYQTQVLINPVAACVDVDQPTLIRLADANGNPYFDGMVPACPSCNDVSGRFYPALCGLGAPWDGRMSKSGVCSWTNACPSPAPAGYSSKTIDASPSDLSILGTVTFSPSLLLWQLQLSCHQCDVFGDCSTISIWIGNKSVGSTPLGTYTRDPGFGCISSPNQYKITLG